MKFVIATKNINKLKELSRILEPMGIDASCEKDLPFDFPEVEETGTTFEENAMLKAKSACEVSGMPAVADDSGLCVDYLNGAPGIYSARFAGEPTNTPANNAKLLKELNGIELEKRTAHFVSAIAVVFPDGRSFTVRGECYGKIGFEEKGKGGFGYDPLFISEYGVFGEMSPDEKDKISHRANALKKLSVELKKYL